MRPIKFRVWNGEDMISPDRIDRDGTAWWKENSIPSSSKELMQFTGLLDKNGVEIYEGDVVRVYSKYDDPTEMPAWEVYWRSSCWHLRNKSGGYDNGDYYHGDDVYWEDGFYHIEVIGNIHENPELVK